MTGTAFNKHIVSLLSLLVPLALTVVQLAGAPPLASAISSTPTTTPALTAEVLAQSTATALPVETPEGPVVHKTIAAGVVTPVVDQRRRHRHAHRQKTSSATVSATVATKKRRHRQRKHHHSKPTPTPIPSPTAPISLQTEDSISPVTCNGPGEPVAGRPFLYSPFQGWTSLVSYFDHDSPNFLQDGIVITTTGLEARVDPEHHAADFPAYWNTGLRQFVYYDGHNGYDYNLYYQPVYAAAAGRVIFADLEYPDAPDHGYGNMVMVDHRNGYVSLYGHFSKLLVHKGQKVRRGQVLGISGNTGHSSGPHLHFTLFHNCSPVDPYGWSGSGSDPLASYHGESSVYLWARQPFLINPPPSWPAMKSLPAVSLGRFLLLRLPPTNRGAAIFTADLKREAQRLQVKLASRGVLSTLSLLRGALRIDSGVSAATLYSMPDVASIGALDVGEDARADVAQALGRAALASRHPRIHLHRSRAWAGFLYQWQGRTFLVGKGVKGEQALLPLAQNGHLGAVRTLQADPTSGAFSVDLGKLSSRDLTVLRAQLKHPGNRGHAGGIELLKTGTHARVGSVRSRTGLDLYAVIAVVIAVLALVATAMATRPRRDPAT